MTIPFKLPSAPQMIDALQRRGMRQRDFKSHTGLSQNFVSNLKLGRRRSVRLEQGLRLYALYAERVLGRALKLAPLRGKARPTQAQAARRCA